MTVVHDTMLAAVREVREGAHRADVARAYGVEVGTLKKWIVRVLEFEQQGHVGVSAGMR